MVHNRIISKHEYAKCIYIFSSHYGERFVQRFKTAVLTALKYDIHKKHPL